MAPQSSYPEDPPARGFARRYKLFGIIALVSMYFVGASWLSGELSPICFPGNVIPFNLVSRSYLFNQAYTLWVHSWYPDLPTLSIPFLKARLYDVRSPDYSPFPCREFIHIRGGGEQLKGMRPRYDACHQKMLLLLGDPVQVALLRPSAGHHFRALLQLPVTLAMLRPNPIAVVSTRPWLIFASEAVDRTSNIEAGTKNPQTSSSTKPAPAHSAQPTELQNILRTYNAAGKLRNPDGF
ncbi:hypothetical protein IW261DRAFT_1421282 [Armillaria novae-zelandiae]|uniref:Uncharacterized protein n=1 Tax=Armillaria novae-zelandiae TaxID=153914 RepID=A0AA39P3W5_9AGAR|nr:hypothetical protein IW261DRAFT_1421282 [Armillaria novae-zelandiae]